ncbi:MAG: LuxR family transcriptional regulator [Rhizobiales bacterium]|nr:LuxR family transcriptional regulator [Hyphomicrobiales bacterium]
MPLYREADLFIDGVRKLATADAIMLALDKVSKHAGLDLMAIFRFPLLITGYVDTRVEGDNVFMHPDIPPTYWPGYQRHYRSEGPTYLLMKVMRSSQAFTFAEAEQEFKSRHGTAGGWIFDYTRSHGYQDGFYCPFRTLAVVFVSRRLLALKPRERRVLFDIAYAAVGQIEAVVAKRRSTNKQPDIDLSDREVEVLQQRALLGSTDAVAKAMDLSIKTVDFHLANARQKLGVEDTAQALLEAYKRNLIDY